MSSRLAANSGVDMQVLAQLLVMQSVVASLPDDAIIPFVLEGLSDIPGVGLVEFHAGSSSPDNAPERFLLAVSYTHLDVYKRQRQLLGKGATLSAIQQ